MPKIAQTKKCKTLQYDAQQTHNMLKQKVML